MVSFEALVLGTGLPIYLQIVAYLKREMVSGTVQDGEELPSRRVLSALLGVNPNTIQKAYRILEEEGLICSHAGAKSYAVVREEQLQKIRREMLEQEARALVQSMRQMGVTREEADGLMGRLWEEEAE